MKKIIKAIGIIAILGSLGVASTTLSDTTTVTKSKTKDITTVQGCDPLEHLMGMCRSSQTLND